LSFFNIFFNLCILLFITLFINFIHKLISFSFISLFWIKRETFIKSTGFRNIRNWENYCLKNCKDIQDHIFNIHTYLINSPNINPLVLDLALEHLDYQIETLIYNYDHYNHWMGNYNKYVKDCEAKNLKPKSLLDFFYYKIYSKP
jgi:hypothetical protein